MKAPARSRCARSFPNPQGLLLPGMFVQALFTQAVDPNVFLVPQQARAARHRRRAPMSSSSAPDNKAVRRKVVATRTYGTNWVVTGGLRAGDKVITQGTANLKSGAPIKAGPAARAAEDRAAARRDAGGGRGEAARPCHASSSTGRSSPGCSRSSSCSPGIGAINSLPIEQYPDIAPPQVNIRATYPGASAETIENSVTQIIEQQLTGIDGLLYFTSSSSSRGSVGISATFEKGTDPDIAQVQVQNQVQQAISRLPQQVQQQGVRVTKSNPDFLLIVAVYDETDQRTNMDVSDYLASNLQDPLSRVPGVGDINVFGAPHAMRIWLNPQRLAAFSLMPSDVVSAIQAQNTEVAAGEVGGLPQPDEPDAQRDRDRAVEAADAGAVPARSSSRPTRAARASASATSRGSSLARKITARSVRVNGHPGAGIAVSLAPGADALKTAELVKATVEQLAAEFPGRHRVSPTPTTRPTSSSSRSTRW